MSALPDLPVSFEPAPLDDATLELVADGAVPSCDAGWWRPGSLGEADWCMSRLREAARELARLDAHAAESHARIDAWRAQAGKRAERTLAFFEGHLKAYAASQRTEKAKTLYLPNGAVASRESKARVVVADEAAAVEWAKENVPAAVKVKESILVGPLREVVAIQPLRVGERVSVHLECGHTDVYEGSHEHHDAPLVGDSWTCYDCPEGVGGGSGDDTHPYREILKVESEPIYQPTVFGPDGEAVPETVLVIEPERIDYTVKPDLG